MDIVGSLLLIVVLSPLMAVIALLVRCTSPGPVVFRQARLTAGGKVFTMYKFRSMVENAEASTGAVWASERDPRITPIGRWLRKFRCDELPQLFNVLSGDMSLIGPRPERPELARELSSRIHSFDKRLSVRAGITGLAQVGQGYVGTVEGYKRKLALDLVYVRNCCFLLDMRIAMRTLIVLITGTGAR